MTALLGPGSTFAGYRIESVLGRGGMGVVYEATDLSLDRPVALKLIAPDLADDGRFRERFLAEPRLAASLDHSSVVPIYEAGEHDGQLYLAMRYVQGSDLRSLLQREGTLEPGRALAILGQVASALDAAHRRGLVHRDVKPANVLLDEDEHAYLTDFGVSKHLGDDTGEVAGTLEYLAPEQIRGEPVAGRTDEYSLACVLYECLAGTPPFRRQTPAETLWAHLREEPPPLESEPALDPVLHRGLAQEPGERYPTCAALIAAAREVTEPPSQVLERRHRVLLAAGAIILAGALTAALLTALPGTEGEGAAAKAPTGNGIAAIGPKSERLAAFVESAAAPSNVAVGEGGVWFLNAANDTVARIDPETRAIAGRIHSPSVPTDIAVGAGAVWLGTGSGDGQGGNWTDTVYRVDPRTDQIITAVRLPGEAAGGDRGYLGDGFPQIAVGAGGVWATGGGAVARIDPDTNRLVAIVKADAYRIAAGREGVWYLSPNQSGAVIPIDPRTNRALPPISVGDAHLSGIAVGGGSVWVTAEREGFVFRITPGASPVTTPIDVGSGATYIAYGAGAAWVGNSLGTVARIDPATNAVVAETPIGAVMSLAAGAGSAWVSTAGATRAGTLPASTCDVVPGAASPDVLIASDLPLQSDDPAPRAMADAIRAVLSEHDFRAGKYSVGYRACDDSSRQTATFERRICAANANAYANADRLVAVIGPQNSGCAEVQLPILNRAPGGPLAMISPTTGVVGLTREGVPPPDGYRGTPEIFYPIGTRHFVRLTSPESFYGAALAVLSKRLGLKRVYVIDDGSGYWRTVLSDPFRLVARKLGVGIAGSAAFDPEARSIAALADRVERSGAQGVLLGADASDSSLDLVKAVRSRLGDRAAIMVGDAFAAHPTDELFDAVGPGLRGVYVATADVPRTVQPLTAAARRVARDVDVDQRSVLEAAQAAELVLAAIAGSDGTRASVLARLQASKQRDGILGPLRFDHNGDMTPGWVPILRITRPDPGFPKELSGGAVVERVVEVPTSILD